MKTKLPKLSAVLLTLAGGLIVLLGANALPPPTDGSDGQPPRPELPPAPEIQEEPGELPAPRSGAELVQRARQMLLGQDSIAAGIRQHVDLYGYKFLGTGSYRQYGKGPRKLLRLEVKMQLDDEVISLLQVRDQRFLWIQRNMLDETRLSRVDLERLRKELGRAGESRPSRDESLPAGYISSPGALSLGGLPALLDGLQAHFDFQPGRAEQIGGEPVWVVEGTWKRTSLVRLMDPAKVPQDVSHLAPDALPPHLPNRVQIVLGRDRLLPYFPFRVDFQRRSAPADGEKEDTEDLRNLLSLEFFEVHLGSQLDERQFRFYAGEEELIDDTAKYVARLRERASSR